MSTELGVNLDHHQMGPKNQSINKYKGCHKLLLLSTENILSKIAAHKESRRLNYSMFISYLSFCSVLFFAGIKANKFP